MACVLSLLAAIGIASASPTIVTQVKDAYPSVSPDGTTLLFQSDRSGHWALYVSDIDGGNVRLLHNSMNDPVVPAWSPDGKMIAYAATVDGQSEIFVMRADGTHSRRLTNDPGDDSHPHWSSDGRIFFNSARMTPDRAAGWSDQWHEIFSMNAEGGDVVQHTNCRAVCTFGSPSPDGRLLAYRKVTQTPGRAWDQSDIARNSEVFVANIDGSDERNISTSPAFDGWPAWSPDSKWVVFASNRDGAVNTGQVFKSTPDGGTVKQVTTGLWSNVQPSIALDGHTLFTYRHFEGDGYEFGHIAAYKLD